jgi:excisionase family DNA binding protein
MHKEKTRGLATVAEARRFLSVSRATVYRMIEEGELPSLKVRGTRRLRWADLEAYVGACERRPPCAVASADLP